MGLFSTLKRNAKLALRKNWGRAIVLLIILISVAIVISILQQVALNVFVVSPMRANPTMELPNAGEDILAALYASFTLTPLEWIIMGVACLLEILMVVPLSLGIVRWFFRLVHGENLGISEAFHFFESPRMYGRALWYDVNISVRAALWAVPFYLAPCAILGVSTYFLNGNIDASRSTAAVASTGVFISAVLFLLATIFYAACVCRYALTPYLLSEGSDVTVREAIRNSVKYTKGHRFSLMWFSFSFIGWLLLSIFILPLLYVIPYYYTSVAIYARYIIEKNRHAAPAEATREFTPAPESSAHPQPETAPEEPKWPGITVGPQQSAPQWPVYTPEPEPPQAEPVQTEPPPETKPEEPKPFQWPVYTPEPPQAEPVQPEPPPETKPEEPKPFQWPEFEPEQHKDTGPVPSAPEEYLE